MSELPNPTKLGRPHTARKKLLNAAYKIMGERGFEASSLAEIIREANVGIGSFYNNFGSKDELARCAFAEHIEQFGLDLLTVIRKSQDAAASTCYAVRRMIEEAERDPAWAGFIINLEPSTSLFHEIMRPHALVGMQIGIESGEFVVDDIEAAIIAIHAVEVAVVKAMLQGKMTSQATHRSVAMPLQMFGVSRDRATYLASLSMSALYREVAGKNSGARTLRARARI
ncbi:MAG: hypothetical protein JWR80_4396 [Bradyrhizobium sp.]|nr:hypothetical protein [Bradyrhizobium sp.]